ncbi:hypothetical protein BT96DRAFT_1003331 [Gymnopus androsaceus JB14]|uniref:Uncharacterized protein n=1 Tax=Gymnopus androsaceus JB14 TaxID=1447944 RepID=A0A6A4GW53_9AGAR|nr:hypothetical protein BT96DRAFT_1003331 [Gymnopus androsaceus JB14]
MSESEYNDPTSGPKWPLIVSSWDAYADSLGEKLPIAYKLTEQLKVYYNGDWKKAVNIKQTKSLTANICVPIRQSNLDPNRSFGLKVAESEHTVHQASQGFISLPSLPEVDSDRWAESLSSDLVGHSIEHDNNAHFDAIESTSTGNGSGYTDSMWFYKDISLLD